MWQVLLAAAVAGSTGFVAKQFLSPSHAHPSVVPQKTKQCSQNNDDSGTPLALENDNLEDPISQPLVLPNGFFDSGFECNSETQDGIFRFSSSESLRQDGSRCRTNDSRKKPVIGRRRSKGGVRVAKVEQRSDVEVRSEHRTDGKRLPFCLKRRKTIKNIAGKAGLCSSKDGSLFGWGLSFGIIYMMSAGKSEISKLSKTMDETAKVVQELKSELHRRKSSRSQKILDSVENIDMNSCKMSGRHDEVMPKKTSNEVTGVRILSLPVSDDGECGSSALTEESDRRVLEIEQLEAELEFELQKLPGCTIDSPYHEEMRPKLHELQVPDEGCHGTDDRNLNYSQSHGVLASELNQKLSHLLIERQGNQIAELESDLHQAESKLHEKEAELQALKDCVRHLTELSLSTVSDDETDARADEKGASNRDSNNMDSESKQSVVGMKRPIVY